MPKDVLFSYADCRSVVYFFARPRISLQGFALSFHTELPAWIASAISISQKFPTYNYSLIHIEPISLKRLDKSMRGQSGDESPHSKRCAYRIPLTMH